MQESNLGVVVTLPESQTDVLAPSSFQTRMLYAACAAFGSVGCDGTIPVHVVHGMQWHEQTSTWG
jgi:hypothetical protein